MAYRDIYDDAPSPSELAQQEAEDAERARYYVRKPMPVKLDGVWTTATCGQHDLVACPQCDEDIPF